MVQIAMHLYKWNALRGSSVVQREGIVWWQYSANMQCCDQNRMVVTNLTKP